MPPSDEDCLYLNVTTPRGGRPLKPVMVWLHGSGSTYGFGGEYGDRTTDIAVFRPSTGRWWIRKSSDKTAYVVEWGREGDQPVPADYDGNGTANPAVYRSPVDGASGEDSGRWMIADTKADVLFGRPGQLPMPGH